MFKAKIAYSVKCSFSGVPEGGMPKVMSQSNSFNKIFIKSERLGYGPCVL